MSQVIPGRFTAQSDESIVVFLIGVRVNKFFAFRKWIPTFSAMGPMIRTLYEHPEKGFLGAQTSFNLRGVVMVQYWRSFEDIERFARDKTDPHLAAWRRFNKAIGTDGSVGIWHETYQVDAGKYEALYNNMPISGLASATEHVPIRGRLETARSRLGRENESARLTDSLESAKIAADNSKNQNAKTL